MSLQSRLAKLEALATTDEGVCPECCGPGNVQLLFFCQDPEFRRPKPEIPICPRCGQPWGNVMLIEEVIVRSREELEKPPHERNEP